MKEAEFRRITVTGLPGPKVCEKILNRKSRCSGWYL
jgi:hypothetical protein